MDRKAALRMLATNDYATVAVTPNRIDFNDQTRREDWNRADELRRSQQGPFLKLFVEGLCQLDPPRCTESRIVFRITPKGREEYSQSDAKVVS